VKIDPATDLVERARQGDLQSLEALLRHIQGPVYNLAMRLLGRREDAQDATQEVLLKVTTHLATWRGESAFGTWVFGITANHVLNLKTRSPGRRELSLQALGDMLDSGLQVADRSGWNAGPLTPEEKLEARQTAISCTQGMLMALDAPGRLAYVLDVIFGLDSQDAAQVQGITPAAHRKRLERSRTALHNFMAQKCSLVSPSARCSCARQLPAKRLAAAKGIDPMPLGLGPAELDSAERGLGELIAMSDAAAVMRGGPTYVPSTAALERIRLVVQQSFLLKQ
jgi:RNA polymerase sigma factor (sigma-70 family)